MSGFMTYAIKMTTQNMQWPFWALDTTPLKVPTHILLFTKKCLGIQKYNYFEIKLHKIMFLKASFF